VKNKVLHVVHGKIVHKPPVRCAPIHICLSV
jgi:hypothetical protein